VVNSSPQDVGVARNFKFIGFSIGTINSFTNYVLKFKAKNNGQLGTLQVYLGGGGSNFDNRTPPRYIPLYSGTSDYEVIFQTDQFTVSGYIIIGLLTTTSTMYFTGLELYKVNYTNIDFDNHVKIFDNPTTKQKTYSLNGVYTGITDNKEYVSVTLEPFTSKVLVQYPPKPLSSPIYVSSSDENASDSYTITQARNPETPWKTISKVNSSFASMNSNDYVLFKRGDVFGGETLSIQKNGTSSGSFNIGAYGIGEKPKITSTIPITNWTSIGSNKFQATIPGNLSKIDVVTINGVFKPIVRYPKLTDPNNGFLTIDITNGSTSIISTGLTSVDSFVGAEVVYKPDLWIIDRESIVTGQTTTVTGTTFQFTRSPYITANTSGAASIKQNWGYFLQNHPNMLTQDGEWCYSPATSTLTIYCSVGTPDYVEVSTVENTILISGNSRNNIKISDLEIFGGKKGINLTIPNGGSIGNNIVIDNCDFNYCSEHAIFVNNYRDISITNNTIKNSLSNGIWVDNTVSTGTTIENNIVSGTSMVYGMSNVINSGEPIRLSSPNTTTTTNNFIRNNRIINSGYNGIRYAGSGILIEKNVIDGFCLTKDDGGAIYSFNSVTPGGGTASFNRTIRNNIILNGYGTTLGKSPTSGTDVEGIYQDAQVRNVNIFDNTISNVNNVAFYSNYPRDIIITGNTCFNNGIGWYIARRPALIDMSGNTISNNVFVNSGSTVIKYYDFSAITQTTNSVQQGIAKIPTVNNNFYYTPNGTLFNYEYVTGTTSFFPFELGYDQYKLFTGLDSSSTEIQSSPYTVTGLVGPNLYGTNSGFTTVAGVSLTSRDSRSIISVDSTSKIGGVTSLRRDVTGTTISQPNRMNLSVDRIFSFLNPSTTISTTKKYIARFSLFSNDNYGWVDFRLRVTASYLSPSKPQTFMSGLTQFEFLVEPTVSASTGNARWEITLNQQSGTVWIDNLEIYEANVTMNNFGDYFQMLYNDTNTEKLYNFSSGDWIRYPELTTHNSIIIQPFTSRIFSRVFL
jgi:hypothetical protein